ncbi:MAG: hypothetical protein Q8P46_13220 [Hyphomicrobiales bacterium]|nr:hypothetical protein [Hyphomicrobiales bacterium]
MWEIANEMQRRQTSRRRVRQIRSLAAGRIGGAVSDLDHRRCGTSGQFLFRVQDEKFARTLPAEEFAGDGMDYDQQIVAAKHLLERYGAAASDEAKLRALELRHSGIQDAARFWFKVAALAHGKVSPQDLAADNVTTGSPKIQ